MFRVRWTVATVGLFAVLAAASLAQAQNQPGGQGGQGKGRQRPGGGGFGRGGFGGFNVPGADRSMLLTNEKVQKELELAEDQLAELKKISEEARPQRGGGGQPNFFEMSEEDRKKFVDQMQERMKASIKKIDEVLLPHQLERLKQISWQNRGVGALQDEEVVESLKITDAQKKEMQAIAEAQGEKMRELFQGGGGFGGFGGQGQEEETDEQRKERQARMEENRKKMETMRKESEEKTMAVLTDEQRTQFEELKGEKFAHLEELRQGPGGRGGPGGQGGPGGRGGKGGKGRRGGNQPDA